VGLALGVDLEDHEVGFVGGTSRDFESLAGLLDRFVPRVGRYIIG